MNVEDFMRAIVNLPCGFGITDPAEPLSAEAMEGVACNRCMFGPYSSCEIRVLDDEQKKPILKIIQQMSEGGSVMGIFVMEGTHKSRGTSC
jgi:hypothetical protein